MKTIMRFLLLLAVMAISQTSECPAAEPSAMGPVPDMVTMLDLGANTCIPCTMMAPIIKELEAQYRGKAAIIFIDVLKNPDAAKKFKVLIIPTQIFFDRSGKEVFRSSGFMDKKSIEAQLAKMGVAQPDAGTEK